MNWVLHVKIKICMPCWDDMNDCVCGPNNAPHKSLTRALATLNSISKSRATEKAKRLANIFRSTGSVSSSTSLPLFHMKRACGHVHMHLNRFWTCSQVYWYKDCHLQIYQDKPCSISISMFRLNICVQLVVAEWMLLPFISWAKCMRGNDCASVVRTLVVELKGDDRQLEEDPWTWQLKKIRLVVLDRIK